mgnify:CR=1 FL=1
MNYSKFIRYNVIGVIAWGTGITLLGVFLGRFEVVAKNIELFTIGFVVLSTIPIWIEGMRARREAKAQADERRAND